MLATIDRPDCHWRPAGGSRSLTDRRGLHSSDASWATRHRSGFPRGWRAGLRPPSRRVLTPRRDPARPANRGDIREAWTILDRLPPRRYRSPGTPRDQRSGTGRASLSITADVTDGPDW